MMTPVIQALNLSKAYEGTLALDDVTLQVGPGEILCLLGPNGAGKTTLLNVLLGFVAPTGGRALLKGIDVAADPDAARRVLAYIPEQVTLYPSLTAIENLRFFSDLAGRRLTVTELERCLAESGLDSSHARRRVSTFSKGMRQKVAVAIAVAKQAEALLLDEPTSGLDPESANEFVEAVVTISRRGCAVLMTTHDLVRATAAGGRIGILRRGRLVAEVASADAEASRLERLYLDAVGGANMVLR